MSEIGIGSIVFTNWEIIELIGHGSFGSVYKIQRKQSYGQNSGARVQYAALKVIYVPKDRQEIKRLRNRGMDSSSVRQYFQDSAERICREIDVMYPLKGHGNIVTYDDYDIIPQESGTGSIILIKMELLTSINDYALDNPMNVARTIQLGIDLCQALEACEKLNIIHRDIKPDNIFVNRFGSFKLGDFGIARTADGTTTGTVTGTYGYMAPEIFNGKKYNATVDIYSLGIVLYQYLNGGRLPFEPPTGQNVTVKDFETASAKRFSGEAIPQIPGIDPELSNIICKSCSYRVEERYQSATEFKKALLQYQKKIELAPMETSIIGNRNKGADVFNKEVEVRRRNTVKIQRVDTKFANERSDPAVLSDRTNSVRERKDISKDEKSENKKTGSKRKLVGALAVGLVVIGLAAFAGKNIINGFGNKPKSVAEEQKEADVVAEANDNTITTTAVETVTTERATETSTNATTEPTTKATTEQMTEPTTDAVSENPRTTRRSSGYYLVYTTPDIDKNNWISIDSPFLITGDTTYLGVANDGITDDEMNQVFFYSDNPDVAYVPEYSWTISAVSPGTCTIYGECGDKQASIQLTVIDDPVNTGVTVVANQEQLQVQSDLTISPDPLEISLEGAENKAICCAAYDYGISFGFSCGADSQKFILSDFGSYDNQYVHEDGYFRVIFWYKNDPDTIIATKKINVVVQ